MNINRRNDRAVSTRSSWDLFRDFDDLFTQLHGTPSALARSEDSIMNPAVDIQENDKGYLMSFDLPGIPEKDVKVEIHDSTLTVSGERRRVDTSNDKGWSRTERSFGRFVRSFSLPPEVDTSKVEAQFENGELHLFVPKGEAAKPRTIQINGKNAANNGGEKKPGLMDRFFGKEKDVNADQGAKH